MYVLEHPELRALVDTNLSISSPAELSDRQRYFVNFALLHIAAAYEAERLGLMTRNRAIARDVGALLALPGFLLVWRDLEPYHTRRFRRFANKAIRLAESQGTLARSESLIMRSEKGGGGGKSAPDGFRWSRLFRR